MHRIASIFILAPILCKSSEQFNHCRIEKLSKKDENRHDNKHLARMRRSDSNPDASFFNHTNLWPDGKVYFKIDHQYFDDRSMLTPIFNAFSLIERFTCVRFLELPSENQFEGQARQPQHLYFTNGQFCSSFVGRQPQLDKQDLTLPIQCLKQRGALHEIIHALGFGHEQARLDRDDFVHVFWENIPEDFWFTFQQDTDGHYLMKYSVPYDYTSIMHYGPYDFAIDKHLPTLMSKNPHFDIPINKDLSSLDIMKINLLYNCTWHLNEQRTLCLDLEQSCREIPIDECSISPYIAHVCRKTCNLCQ